VTDITLSLALARPQRRVHRRAWHRIGIYSVLIAASIFFVLPLYVMVTTALKTMPEIRGGSVLALPASVDLAAFVTAWSKACIGATCDGIRIGFFNSVKITVPSVALATILGAIGGYTISFWRFRGADAVFGILLFGIFIPYQVFVFPLIRLTATLGLYGTVPGIVLIHVAFGLPVTTLMFRNYFATIPIELFNAARVDGAGFWLIFRRIMLPLSAPMIVVSVIWQATASWNDYLFGLVFAGRNNQPMTTQLQVLARSDTGAPEYNVIMAATLLTALVPLVIYFVSGKWFVRGIAAGAVKG
jgi:glucose/mannose transport system permease protein